MAYLTGGTFGLGAVRRRRRRRGFGQVGTAGGCPGSPGCPGYVVTTSDLWNLPLTGPYANPSPQTTAQLALMASALNPNLISGSTFTDWLNAHATAAAWIGGIAVGVLLLSRL